MYLTEVQHTSADMAPTNATSFWKQKSTIYSWLAPVAEDFVCAPASPAYVERIFLCVAFSDAVACSSHLKCVLVWNQKVLCRPTTGFALCLTAAFEQFSFVLFESNSCWLILTFLLMWQYDTTGKKSLCNRKFSIIKKLYNIKTKIITRELYKN